LSSLTFLLISLETYRKTSGGEVTDVGNEALDLLTAREVAKRLRVSERTVKRLIYANRKEPGAGLESVKIGELVRVAPEAVIEYKARLRAAAQAPASQAPAA
jgi:excisionase family DNA binding protein